VNAVPTSSTSLSNSGSDDDYQTVVINALLAILKDSSLSTQHYAVIEAIMYIFKSQGLKCVNRRVVSSVLAHCWLSCPIVL
jgi:serine/threonine-protein kinase mTOR